MSKVFVSKSIFTSICDGIRNASGNNNLISIDNISNSIQNLTTSSSTNLSDLINYKNAADVNNENIKHLRSGAFHNCTGLTSINLPACTVIGDYAFHHCTSLTSIDLPACTNINSYAFHRCTSLTTISLPVCTTVGEGGFDTCIVLTSISLPACTTVERRAFADCYKLTSVDLPACESVGEQSFLYCDSLSSVNLPSCLVIGRHAFMTYGEASGYIELSKTPLTYLNIPKCVEVKELGLVNSLFKESTTFTIPSSIKIMSVHAIESPATAYIRFDHSSEQTDLEFADKFIQGGDSKLTVVINVYTDNEYIRDKSSTSANEYTTVNLYHKDGTAW